MLEFILSEKSNQKIKQKFKIKNLNNQIVLNNYNSIFLSIYNKCIDSFSQKLNNIEIMTYYTIYDLKEIMSFSFFENELYFLKNYISKDEKELKEKIDELKLTDDYIEYEKEEKQNIIPNNNKEIIKINSNKKTPKKFILEPIKNNDNNKEKNKINNVLSVKELNDFIKNVNLKKQQTKKP